jgi:hypothetical protein
VTSQRAYRDPRKQVFDFHYHLSPVSLNANRHRPCLLLSSEVTPNWGTDPSILKPDPFPAFAIRSSQRLIVAILSFSIISLFESGMQIPRIPQAGSLNP